MYIDGVKHFIFENCFLCKHVIFPLPMEANRKNYNTTLRADLIKRLKILAAETDRRQNDLLEEAVEDLLKRYAKPQPKK